MKLFVVVLVLGVTAAEKLDNTYLPPLSAKAAGGSGSILSTPFQGGRPFGGFSGGNFGKTGPSFSNALRSFPLSSAPTGNYGVPTGNAAYYNQQDVPIIPSPAVRGYPNIPVPEYGPPSGNGIYRGSIQPSYYPKSVQILRYNNDNTGDGTYRFQYETENKIFQQERGQLKNAGTGQESSVVEGSYSYAAPDGQTISVSYVADENGFQASGDHLPVAPPIPEAIQKSLQINAASGYPSTYSQGNGQQSGQYFAGPDGQYQSGQLNRQYLTPTTQAGYRY